MTISQLLKPESISPDLESTGKLDVLTELGGLLANICQGGPSEKQIISVLVERERLATTGVGEGVAIPHAKLDNLDNISMAIGISRTGIHFDAVDGQPVHIFVALLAPEGSTGEHLKALAGISRILKDPSFRNKLLGAKSSQEIYDAIIAEEDGKN